MCGILGAVSNHLNKEQFHNALQQLDRRGPDAEGVEVFDNNIYLGHKRLSILDLSELGNQPMQDDTGRYNIIFNGEVYNFPQIREQLKKKNYKFKSTSDTEVVLKAFVEFGPDAFNMLDGMFGLAIYDSLDKKLTIARDPLGIKQVYFFKTNQDLAFASEIKALKELPIFPKEIDPKGITGFLQIGSMPGTQTLYKNVKLLPPGCFLEYKDGTLTEKKYYSPPIHKEKITSYNEAKEELFTLMKNAVSKRMVADVPLGAFLSGGIDSSSVVAMMREVENAKINTFSISFNEEKFSEGSIAQIVADKYETNHNNCIVTANDLKQEFSKIVDYMDVPTVDGINTYFVSKFTRESGTIVSLSGLGGDELFGGYRTFDFLPQLLSLKSKTKLVPNFLINTGGKFLKKEKHKRIVEYLTSKGDPKATAYNSVRGLLPDELIEGIVPNLELFDKIEYLTSLIEGQNYSETKDITSFYEVRGYMLNQLLRDSDIMSMAHSLEVRVPLIDKSIVDFAFKLPDEFKNKKRIIIDALGEKLPEEVYNRPKQGFMFPFPVWIKNELKSDLLDIYFSDSEYFNKNQLEKMWNQFLDGDISWSRIWAIAVLKAKLI